jgi:hypothetical protein
VLADEVGVGGGVGVQTATAESGVLFTYSLSMLYFVERKSDSKRMKKTSNINARGLET